MNADSSKYPILILTTLFAVAQAVESGKPKDIAEKMVAGKLRKALAKNALLEQPFVKNPEQTIKDLVTEKIAKLGENIVIRRFARFQIGE